MKSNNKVMAFLIVIILVLSAFITILFYNGYKKNEEQKEMERLILPEGVSAIIKTYNFSYPIIEEKDKLMVIKVNETNLQSMGDGRPVIPVNLTTIEFPFGTEIIDINYTYSEIEVINISKKVSHASCSATTVADRSIYNSKESYPSDFVTYHTGGGLSGNKHKTFLNIRVNPVTYIPAKNKLNFVNKIEVTILYKEPVRPIITESTQFDLLIISPEKYSGTLKPLADHKEKQNVKTLLATVENIYEKSKGRDEAEKIKYYIKSSIEQYGIKSVLLVGGLDGRSSRWSLPVRYSHILIREGTQEELEPEFLSDLYYADIYDSKGNFSSWDTNNNDIFAEYDGKVIDEMDFYPDVQLGRLPCTNKKEVKSVVDKIINYESNEKGEWFDNIVLVSGDHWPDKNNIAEGVLIMEETKEIMSDFKPVEIYATDKNNKMMISDITQAISKGAGFAYFCGHGSTKAWGIYYPPAEDKVWAPSLGPLGKINFYKPFDMNFLRNKNKLPVTIVGGCNNGQFDVDKPCWAWKLTSLPRRGAIATIANTALGTHAKDDSDYNGVNDYLEAYDGWLELKFFKLYSEDNINILGQLHQEAITNYLNMFLGNHDEMDTKMVQQWELCGDPSLVIG